MPQAVEEKVNNGTPPPQKKSVTPTIAANQTTVSANLVDLGGVTWAGALITINFQPAPNIPGPYFWGGGMFSLRPQLQADSSGHFQIALPDNTTITPAGSTWQFVIAPNATMPAVIFNLMVAGSAMDISSVFTAQSYQVSLGVIQSLPLPRAYANTDMANPTNSGQIFYNTAQRSIMLWEENQWNPVASVNGIPYPPGTDPDYFNNFGTAGIPSGTYGLPDNTLTEWNIVTFPGAMNASGRIQMAASYNDPQFRIWIRAAFGMMVPPDWSPWRVIPSGSALNLPDGSDPDYFYDFGVGGINQGNYGIPDPTLERWTFFTIPGAAGTSGRIQLAASYDDTQFRLWARADFGHGIGTNPPGWAPWKVLTSWP